MDVATKYFELAAQHVRLSELLKKTLCEMSPGDEKSQAICDALNYCLRDLEAAMASGTLACPQFSELRFHAALSYQQNQRWFERDYKSMRPMAREA